MNLAGNQAKNLFKAIRTGRSPSVVGLWTAATVVDQLRQRTRPKKELLLRKTLKPGQSYVIRVPGKGEAALTETVPADTVVAEATDPEPSIASQLLATASGLLAAAAVPDEQPDEQESVADKPKRVSRRQRRKERRAAKQETAPVEDDGGSFVGALADVAASFTDSNDDGSDAEEPSVSRRTQRRQARLAGLDEAELDRDALPRRRRRKLRRAERRAQKRPTRRRARRARRQQRKAKGALDRLARKQAKLRRAEKRLAAAQAEVDKWREREAKRSTRRRRRKLRKAEKALAKLVVR